MESAFIGGGNCSRGGRTWRVLRFSLRLREFHEGVHALFAVVTRDVPFGEQSFDEPDERSGLLGLNVDKQVHVLLHMRANVSNVAHGIDRFPRGYIDLLFERGDFIDETWLPDAPKVADHSLQAAPA